MHINLFYLFSKSRSDLGLTPKAIAVRSNRDPKTVRKYLQSEVYNDPDIMRMVDIIKEREGSFQHFFVDFHALTSFALSRGANGA